MIRIKICCISSVEEAALALEHGADALGLVSAMPSGPGVIADAAIAEIAAWGRGRASLFLLTSRRRAAEIATQIREAGTDTVQIVDAIDESEYALLREALPRTRLVQVIHVRSGADVDEALRVAPQVDALLLDSGNPNAAVKTLGGTGQVHDWTLSRAIVAQSPVPVWLAGGLNAENARRAIDAVGPHGLDICSGVRRDGRLAADRLAGFVAAVRG